jgi:endothelin-converting enzyme/putative endopeptidase
MTLLIALLIAAQPLQQLPYTPSLDLSAMDKLANPCTDFYQYTCGGWMKNNPIPGDQSSWSVYGKLADENQQFLWGILEDAAKNGPQKIGDFFASCMDEPSIEKLGASPLKPELAKIDALTSKGGLVTLLPVLHLSTSGKGLIFGFGSDQDFGDATQVIAYLDAGGLGLPDRDYYFKGDAKSKEIRDKYVQHVAAMLRLIGEKNRRR